MGSNDKRLPAGSDDHANGDNVSRRSRNGAAKRRRRAYRNVPRDSDNAMPLGLVLTTIQRWWKIALPIALVLAVVSAGTVWYLFEPVYRASAWVQIEDDTPYIAFESREESGRFVQTQIELFRSPLVIGPVVSQQEVARLSEIREMDDPIRGLADEMRVASVGKSELYEISFDSTNPGSAARLVNAVVDEYFKQTAQKDASRTQRVIELLDEEQERRAREVQRLREKVHELGRQALAKAPLGGSTPEEIAQAQNPLVALQEQLAGAEVERKVMETRVASLEEALAAGNVEIPAVLVQSAIDGRAEVQAIRSQIAEKRVQQQSIKALSALGEDDPAYRRLAKEIEADELALEQTCALVRPSVEQEVRAQAVMSQKDQLDEMRLSLERSRVTEQMFRDRYDSQLKQMGESGSHSLDLQFARAELAREEEVFEQIAQRALALRTEMRAPARVTLMKRADTPSVPIESLPWKQLAAVLLASFGLPFGLAMLWERNVRRITDTEQLKQFGLPFVAEVAALPSGKKFDRRTTSPRTNVALNMFEESIDSLRTSLLLGERRNAQKVILIASGASAEGKTSVAAQLTVAMARVSTEPVLLIDADMRSPDLHRIFGVSGKQGLADVLRGACSVDQAVVRDWDEHVHILPAGELRGSPHKLLGNGAFENLLNHLQGTYGRIIIDSPPILFASESLVMAKHADATLLCAMRRQSRMQRFKLAHERLTGIGVWPAGVVLSGVPQRRYSSDYGAYAYHNAQAREALVESST